MTPDPVLIRDAHERWVPLYQPPRPRERMIRALGEDVVRSIEYQLRPSRPWLAAMSQSRLPFVLGCSIVAWPVIYAAPPIAVLPLLIILAARRPAPSLTRGESNISPLHETDSFSRRDVLLQHHLCASCGRPLNPGSLPTLQCDDCGAFWVIPEELPEPIIVTPGPAPGIVMDGESRGHRVSNRVDVRRLLTQEQRRIFDQYIDPQLRWSRVGQRAATWVVIIGGALMMIVAFITGRNYASISAAAIIGAYTSMNRSDNHSLNQYADIDTARGLLACRRCPSCLYELEMLPADSAGLTRCPECGAAWNLGSPP